MNYPTVMQNPLLAKQMTKKDKVQMQEKIKFDNMVRPISGYQHTDNFKRPLSTTQGGETLMHKRKELQENAWAKDKPLPVSPEAAKSKKKVEEEEVKRGDKGLPHSHSLDGLSQSTHFQFGRSIQSGFRIDSAAYTIKNVENVFSSFPVKKPTTAKEKKAAEEKRKQMEEEAAALALIPKNTTNEEALSNADGWQNSVSI